MEDSYQIFIDMKYRIITLDVSSYDTIESIKAKLSERVNINPVYIYLYFQGRLLEEGRTIMDYNIGKESFIQGYIRNNKYNEYTNPKRFGDIKINPIIKDFYIQKPVDISVGDCSKFTNCEICNGKAYPRCKNGYVRVSDPNCFICRKR